MFRPRPIHSFLDVDLLHELLNVCALFAGQNRGALEIVEIWQGDLGRPSDESIRVSDLLSFPFVAPIAALVLQGQWMDVVGLGRWTELFGDAGLPPDIFGTACSLLVMKVWILT